VSERYGPAASLNQAAGGRAIIALRPLRARLPRRALGCDGAVTLDTGAITDFVPELTFDAGQQLHVGELRHALQHQRGGLSKANPVRAG
jgi:hypothetical protein